jgi:hypothetical protein
LNALLQVHASRSLALGQLADVLSLARQAAGEVLGQDEGWDEQ